ncbi:MAG: MBL fold metallo-hydrolase, partial [Verrucomicrobiota bacterium]
VDTGPDFRAQCLREGITELDAAIFTHAHSDHIMGFDDLRRFCRGEDATIPIYGTPECLNQIKTAFGFAFDRANWYAVYVKPVAHEVKGPFQLEQIEVTPLEVRHGKVRTIGYRFEGHGKRFAYVPDCKFIGEQEMELMSDLDCLILDATSYRDLPTHYSVSEALETVEQLKPGETWLTHMCHDIDHDLDDAKLPTGVNFAYDGLKLHIV